MHEEDSQQGELSPASLFSFKRLGFKPMFFSIGLLGLVTNSAQDIGPVKTRLAKYSVRLAKYSVPTTQLPLRTKIASIPKIYIMMFSKRFRRCCTKVCLFSMFMWTFADFANADLVWDGGGTDANWTTGDNWDADTAPDTITPEALSFAGLIQTTTNNDFADDALTVTGINFTNAGVGVAESFTLDGNRVGLGGDISTTASNGAIEDTINLQLRLTGNRTVNTGTNHHLTINGIISDDGTPRTLTKIGGATLKLSGANTFSGGMTIGNGSTNATNVVQIGVDSVGSVGAVTSSALGTGTLTFAGGKLSSDGATSRTILNDVTLNGGGGLRLGWAMERTTAP